METDSRSGWQGKGALEDARFAPDRPVLNRVEIGSAPAQSAKAIVAVAASIW
jgi:hypothetical protein